MFPIPHNVTRHRSMHISLPRDSSSIIARMQTTQPPAPTSHQITTSPPFNWHAPDHPTLPSNPPHSNNKIAISPLHQRNKFCSPREHAVFLLPLCTQASLAASPPMKRVTCSCPRTNPLLLQKNSLEHWKGGVEFRVDKDGLVFCLVRAALALPFLFI